MQSSMPQTARFSEAAELTALFTEPQAPSFWPSAARSADCKTGEAKITKGYKLHAKYVIHTPGPVWHGGSRGEPELLRSCYRSCLELASENGCKTVDFPSISTGVYHFPLDKASQIAIKTIAEYLFEHPEIERVRMVCFDERTKDYYENALESLK